MDEAALQHARDIVASSRRTVFLTGAGISTASGIPDYRGPDGVWTKNPGAEQRSTIAVWMSDASVRRAGWQRRATTSWDSVQPNAAHHAITAYVARRANDLVVTQNIDGLHQRAGLSLEQLIEIHGTVHRSVCMSCGEQLDIAATLARVIGGEEDPRCLRIMGSSPCGGIMKAATISFGQSLREDDLNHAFLAARDCDVLIAAGSTLAVFPIASMVPLALENGATVIVMNGSPTAMDRFAQFVFSDDLTLSLPALLDT